MGSPDALQRLAGRWSGTYRLWRSWISADSSDSPSTLVVAPEAGGSFLGLRYTWSVDGADHEGLLLVGQAKDTGRVETAWIDSWHSNASVLVSRGEVDGAGVVTVAGSYAAPPGPDWGWRTLVDAHAPDALAIEMYNVTPDGDEELAVRATYTRS